VTNQKVRISIRTKIFVIITALLLTSIGVYLFLSAQTFQVDKMAATFDLNRNAVVTLSSQFEVSAQNAVEKLKLLTALTATPRTQRDVLENIIETDPVLAHVEILERTEVGKESILRFALTQKRFNSAFGLDDRFFSDEVLKAHALPWEQISSPQVYYWNATTPKGPPMVGVGFSMYADTGGSAHSIFTAVAYLRMDSFLKSLKEASVTTISVLNRYGYILAHSDLELMLHNYGLVEHPLFQEFAKHISSTGVKRYAFGDQDIVGAFASVAGGNIVVLSEIQTDKALQAVVHLMKRSVLFGGIVCSIAFLVLVFFAESITGPLRSLTAAMQSVAAGDITQHVPVNTTDEVGVLSGVFNNMTTDLQTSRNALLELNRDLETKVKERTQQLEEMAIRDPLTGLYNRRYFNQRLKEEISRSTRNGKPISVAYLDIDHFKKYNDTNGHPMGDVLLKQFATLLAESIRQTDVVARLGGEEFCVILPETSLENAMLKAEKLRAAVATTKFPNGEKQPLGMVSCSVGVSEYPSIAKDEEALIRTADEALYEIKKGGRNCVGAATLAPKQAVSQAS
jgi:diguanylate cyclase (GGDEF)-like protein